MTFRILTELLKDLIIYNLNTCWHAKKIMYTYNYNRTLLESELNSSITC